MFRSVACTFVFLMALGTPVASGLHTAPNDFICPEWMRSIGTSSSIPCYNFIEGDKTLLVTVESASESGTPFLSLDNADAGAAAKVALDASIPSGLQSTPTSFSSGVPTQSWEIKLGGTLSKNHYLNLTRPILGRVFWTHTPGQATSASGRGFEHAMVRGELFMGDKRVGGSQDTYHVAVTTNAWFFLSINIWPEVGVLEAGQPLSLRIQRSGGLGDFLVGTGAPAQSFIEIRYSDTDPLSGGVYLENRKIKAYEPGGGKGGTASDEEQTLPGSPLWIVAAPLLALASPRRARARTLAAMLVLGASLGGCLGGDATDKTAGDGPQPTASISYENGTGAQQGAGSIQGIVRDDLNFTIPGAHVSLLGTNQFVETDRSGEFVFANLTPRAYTMRVDAKGFNSLEQSVEVLEGKVARVNVTLVQPISKAGNQRPHSHGDWGDETRKQIQSTTFTFTGCSAQTVDYCERQIPIDYGVPVPPGTARVEVALKWTPASGVPGELALRAVTGVPHSQWRCNGSGCSGGPSYQWYVARDPGEPFFIAVFPNEADPGHQRFTNWFFYAGVTSLDPLSPWRAPPTSDFQLQVTMWAHKGVVPFEPAHVNHWGNLTEMALVKDGSTGPSTSATIVFPTTSYSWAPMKDAFIPAGTKEIRGTFKWTTSTSPFNTNWKLVYKPANYPAGKPTYFPVTLQGAGADWSFVITPKAEELDQFYQLSSNWRFYVEDENQQFNSGQQTTWRLSATAYRDPEWKPE